MSHTAPASATRLHVLHDSTLPGARHSSMNASNILVAWTLERDGDSARCVLGSVGDRVELHISMSHDVVLSQRCGSPEQAAAVSDAWWMALVSRGWLAVGTSVAIKPKLDRRQPVQRQ
jgi:hypothetical protein